MSKGRLLVPFLLLLALCSSSSSSDTLTPSQTLAGNQTLVSAGEKFELGFFSTSGANGNKLYLGIWYFRLPVKTIVWVANRDSPARSSSASLKLGSSGQIFIADQGSSGPVVWSSNHSNTANPVLQLLDSGNLVVRDASNSGGYIWQSFDYPTDTLLPGQKFGWDKNTGLDRYLTSWRSTNDPSSGNYTFRLDRAGDPEAFLLKGGTQRTYRSGPWVGLRFSGVPEMKPSMALNFSFHDSPSEAYYIFNLVDLSIKSRLMVDSTGNLNRFTWVSDKWIKFWGAPKDPCDSYMECGPYGVCNAGSLFDCGCPTGFGPRNPSAWALRDGSDGCARRTRLECGSDGFAVLRDMKLPESGAAVMDDGKSLEECGEACRKDCNCTAYANRQLIYSSGSGCVMWSGDLRDMRTYTEGGQDLYIRVALADLGSDDSGKSRKATIGAGALIGFVILLFTAAVYFKCRKRKHTLPSNSRLSSLRTTQRIHNDVDKLQLPLYDFEVVLVATNNFSNQNKLGEGGFGHVYKGVLKEEDVAIKRLSRHSGQGLEEFKNEVMLIAKLQHRNLVRLLGCCLQGEEKILIYEYLPNRSLDTILFDKERCSFLDWHTRFNIICGIARGLQYLHHDSRLRIIHRDLKSSNVLLDCDMNPKISDFGMARIFGGDETASTNTRRIVGTYGYMAPEYAMYGAFSIKSDVFSFGVLVLEIISGKANTRFYNSEDDLSLLAYAWRMWNEGRGRELVDPSIAESYSRMEVERCIQIGLLCVQERAEKRPNMTSVVVSLSSEIGHLPQPQLPAFCSGRRPSAAPDSSFSPQNDICSVNQVTVTVIDGR